MPKSLVGKPQRNSFKGNQHLAILPHRQIQMLPRNITEIFSKHLSWSSAQSLLNAFCSVPKCVFKQKSDQVDNTSLLFYTALTRQFGSAFLARIDKGLIFIKKQQSWPLCYQLKLCTGHKKLKRCIAYLAGPLHTKNRVKHNK